MNRLRVVLVAALFLSLGSFAYAQQTAPSDQQEQPPRNRQVTPSPRQPEAGPARGQEENRQTNPQPETRPPKAERQETPRPSNEQPKAPQGRRGASAEQGQARPAGKSAHIPDPRFKANFGRSHAFTVNRVITTTTIVPNQTRFVDAGYTFIFLDPWPADWLFTDECYIDYIDGDYFLVDVFHPGVRVLLFVVG